MREEKVEEKIRELAEQLSVPESLEPHKVEERLVDVKQKRTVLYHGHFKKAAAVAAACFVFVIAGGLFFLKGVYPEKRETLLPEQKEEVSRAGEKEGTPYRELCLAINSYNKDMQRIKSVSSDMSNGMRVRETAKYSVEDAAQEESDDFSDTDTQVKGIMEGDIVKTDGVHIFTVENTVDGGRIRIYTPEEKKVSLLAQFHIKDEDVQEMYVEGKYLYIIAQSWEEDDTMSSSSSSSASEDVIAVETAKVDLFVYDISDAAHPKKITEHSQSGNFRTSRFRDGFLYTFTDYSVSGKDHKKEKPETFVPKVDGSVLKEEDIAATSKGDNNRYMVMTSLNADQPDTFSDIFSAFGGSDVYYMNENHIYVTEAVFSENMDAEERTRITRFSYENGIFKEGMSKQIRGRIENSYYMHEYEGHFCFVYTRYKKGGTENGICVMDDKLDVVGKLTGLGEDETIYASYFMDNMAYFVTYRETDPVFAVDLSNPEKPELKSELKLPGFSEYLHSFGEGKLIGIGMGEESQVKLSLFEYDENHLLEEKDTFLTDEKTGSIAGMNHKAVFVDEERSLVGFAVEDWNNGKESYQVYRYRDGRWKRVMKQKKISSIWNVRGLRIKETFYVVDVEKGIKAYDMEELK